MKQLYLWLIFSLAVSLPQRLLGQSLCPTVTTCKPGNAPTAAAMLGMGIHRVTLAALDTTVSTAPVGYQDYSCQARPIVLARGGTYTVKVQTNPSGEENLRAWLDFNNDGQFDQAAERVLLSNNARLHTTQFTVPTSAVTGVALRLRIASDYFAAPFPTPCFTPQYGEAQDYRVVIMGSLPRPTANFVATDTVLCGGSAAFRDLSGNSVSSWRWHFGDGTQSTQQHPQHAYAAPGRYTVKLVACNATACDSLTRTSYVRVPLDAPRPAVCQPATLAYCCSYGVTRLQLGELSWPSADGQAGYEDFSCVARATLTADRQYTLQLTTGSSTHDVAIYLDYNDDGTFTTNELLTLVRNVRSPSFPLTISSSQGPALTYNRPLRLRIIAEMPLNSALLPCQAVQAGQVEDYSVVIKPNTLAPTTGFTMAYNTVCAPVEVALINTTTGGATSYEWSFGDGATSTLASPPPHRYAQAGAYELRLVARNAFGTDTMRQFVGVSTGCPAYCPAKGTGGSYDSPTYFSRVLLGTIDNEQPRAERQGYFDFTAQSTILEQQGRYTLLATSRRFSWPDFYEPDTEVGAWIDFNQNGTFDEDELIGKLLKTERYVMPFRVPASAKPGVTRLRLLIFRHKGNFPYFIPCPPQYQESSVEDYNVIIVPPVQAPRAGFRTPLPSACNALVQFTDTSTAVPATWRWDFGDGAMSTDQHPAHRYAATGTYQVTLEVQNRFGRSLVSRPYSVMALNQGARPSACTPINTPARKVWSPYPKQLQFTLGTLRYADFQTTTGYKDLTCALPAVQIARTGSVYRLGPVTSDPNFITRDLLMHIWLDLNDDGKLDPATELIANGRTNIYKNTGVLDLPTSTPMNTPLRLRVKLHFWSWPAGMPWEEPEPCTRDTAWSIVRDFSVVLSQVTAATPAVAQARAWSVSPNPSTGLLTLHDLPSGAELEVLDAQGRRVRQQHLSRSSSGLATLDLRSLPRGLYVLRLVGQSGAQKILLE